MGDHAAWEVQQGEVGAPHDGRNIKEAHMRRFIILIVLALTFPVIALAQTQTPAQTAAEKAIRETDAALAKAVAAKNADECAAFFDREAALPSAAGTVYGVKVRKAIRAEWEKMLAIPGFNLKWTTEELVVLKSGNLAFSSGTWDNGVGRGKFFTCGGSSRTESGSCWWTHRGRGQPRRSESWEHSTGQALHSIAWPCPRFAPNPSSASPNPSMILPGFTR